ncbi:MAG: sigma E protease regulator RseP [Pseudomonadales bacterium]|nr:sigma E protease regulator RseP [Pseudomonadales bacterium]MCP5302583.1 sigma E protease regulator RseP [Pseudomonadales bacterium]
MNIIQIVLATLVTLGILVTIHEYGHFWVARRCGVKVLRFSVGFGRALYSWRDRHGTEFVLAAIPLGGYVKMLDEREGDVAPEDAKYAFNRQSVGKRIAVVVAGPLANFLFAIVAYWLLFVVGVNTVVPVIGDVKPDSMAARAGLQKGQEITAVGDVRTTTWQAINIQLLGYIGDSGELLLTTRALNGEIEQRSTLLLDNWLRGVEQPDPLEDMGVKPYVPPIPPIVGQVLEQSAGERAGLKAQDKITTLDGDAIDEWQTFVAKIKAHPQQPVLLGVERDNQSLLITVTPDAKQLETGEVVGYLGVGAKAFEWPAEMRRDIKYSVFSAWAPALGRTWEMSALTLASLKKMLVGMISIKNLSGPITIAKVAGASVDKGIEPFLNFLAYLSISLGLINILPIPVLDGGHLMYYLVELVRGRPVSEKVQMMGLRIGMSIIMALMLLALYNDLARL